MVFRSCSHIGTVMKVASKRKSSGETYFGGSAVITLLQGATVNACVSVRQKLQIDSLLCKTVNMIKHTRTV